MEGRHAVAEENRDQNLEQLLRNTIEAMLDPTRGAILLELERAGEMTATQLARQLDLTANNVYHHMRVLSRLGILEPPCTVPGKTYVEKYYRVKHELSASTRDHGWVDRVQRTLTPEERKALFISMCLSMAQMLRHAARRYERMDAEELDAVVHQEQLGMLSINHVSEERLRHRLAGLRELIAREAELFPDEAQATSYMHVVLMAALPLLWPPQREGAV
jgi:DNA-binding transcriptional ArsR family regulator